MKIGEEFNPEFIAETVDAIRAVILNHHAPIEHAYIFPKFKEANMFVEMCDILKRQHERADELQKIILNHANTESTNSEDGKNLLIDTIKKTIKVFRVHIDREDTEMFPYFKDVVTPYEFYELGEKIHNMVYEKWGEKPYGSAIDKVTHVEKMLGINDLDSFTPKL